MAVASLGRTMCITSMSPERRFASRTLSSGMTRKITLSNFACAGSKYWDDFSTTMRSWATRSANCHGPTHTGAVPKLSPSFFTAVGDSGIPARSVSCASSGEYGALSRSRTVSGSTTSTASTGASSLARLDPFSVRWRSSENFTASASIGVPSLNFTPARSLMVTVRPPSVMAGSAAASCGAMRSPSSIS